MASVEGNSHLTTGGDDPFLPKLIAAINSASHFDIAVAFIRSTGLVLLHDALLDALQREPKKVQLRIITGDYLCITEPRALRRLMLLQELGAEIKIFESKGKTSFHMKAYLFTHEGQPDQGWAFIGSSNISQAALKDGLEWNLQVDKAENIARFDEITRKYAELFADARAQALNHKWIDHYETKYEKQRTAMPAPERDEVENEPPPQPNEIQLQALAALNATRDKGFRRGLVVLATGMGKTWLSAFDAQAMNAKRVLFVAHREEILLQAEETFLCIQPDAKVGRYRGNTRDFDADYLFASIGTLGKIEHLKNFATDRFDYIVVDEFHHAAARTYQQLLGYFNPRFLLGLTATPERTDQSDILSLCDDNLVYCKELFEGINAEILSPFSYYGIGDNEVDYTAIPWRNGKFDAEALLHQMATNARAKFVLNHWQKYQQTRTLAFCISKKHADFMANFFNKMGIKAASVHSDSTLRRNEAISALKKGDIKVLFSVDLFNEGVDIPSIDTVLMLRPTESKIVFLQQLGRGLRLSPATGKDKLVVVDFIGNHISFFRKAEALFKLGITNKAKREFVEDIKDENLELPEGCFANYDVQAIEFMDKLTATRVDVQDDIYRSLRETLNRRPSIAEFYRAGGSVETIRREHGQWFAFTASHDDLTENEKNCYVAHQAFLLELETTSLSKSFKLVLLEAFIELEGFITPTTTLALAEKSFDVLQRRRLLQGDLPEKYQNLNALDEKGLKAWHTYWKGNPIKAWIGGNKTAKKTFFSKQGDSFTYKEALNPVDQNSFVLMVQELVNYRFLQYEARLSNRAAETDAKVLPFIKPESQDIPYFSDLRIACGHFRSSLHESDNIDFKSLPLIYGHLDPAKHFIAQASGNSMSGGKQPIQNGDYLLLEMITPVSAGSNNGKIVAIERQDITGDDQYLLRTVHKTPEGQYQLIANNPDYPPMMANEDMHTFARLKAVIDPVDLYLHQSFMREDIPELFGLEFNTGLWKSGHVCPKGCDDQFLLVTLNKQGKAAEHQYHDYFIDQSHFHWQSQNSTAPTGAKGKAIIDHEKDGKRVHLFVRKNKLEAKKGAPFIYCGKLQYLKHEGEKPMSVEWALSSSLSEGVWQQFM